MQHLEKGHHLLLFLQFGSQQKYWGGGPDVAPNAMDNFCFEVTLSYRRLERPRRAQ
jgi:hypothetical protein